MTSLPKDSIYPRSRTGWREWLAHNYTQTTGIWLISDKKNSKRWQLQRERERLTYDVAVEEALCYGWIDSKPRKLDSTRTMLWFTPRKAGTGWSALNKSRIERLMETGKMAEPGRAKIDVAKADGSWEMLDAVERLEVPPDLESEFGRYSDGDGDDSARRNWEGFPRSVKRGILEWILQAKKPETRAKRIAETVRRAGQNERANQWKGEGHKG